MHFIVTHQLHKVLHEHHWHATCKNKPQSVGLIRSHGCRVVTRLVCFQFCLEGQSAPRKLFSDTRHISGDTFTSWVAACNNSCVCRGALDKANQYETVGGVCCRWWNSEEEILFVLFFFVTLMVNGPSE